MFREVPFTWHVGVSELGVPCLGVAIVRIGSFFLKSIFGSPSLGKVPLCQTSDPTIIEAPDEKNSSLLGLLGMYWDL